MGTQAPLPSQVDAWCNVDPPLHVAAHAPFGSVPAAKAVHSPTLPAIAQEEQPPQACLQQTPWAQTLLMQSVPITQLWPLGVRLVQEPPWQVSPVTQSPSPEQVVRQEAPVPQR
jgi:hypothetical protein